MKHPLHSWSQVCGKIPCKKNTGFVRGVFKGRRDSSSGTSQGFKEVHQSQDRERGPWDCAWDMKKNIRVKACNEEIDARYW